MNNMLTSINASHFCQKQLNDRSVIYSASSQNTAFISSFKKALNPSIYQDQFDSFAYVLVNKITHEFLLVRDHLGVQPLYYYYEASSKTLIFGDTIPDILRHLSSEPRFLESEILNIFSDANHYSDDTVYEGVHRVEPGHMIHGKADGQLFKKPFWQLEREGDELHYRDKSEYLEHFSALMDEAVQYATKDSDKIAAEFSAGMDSTAIYCASVARGVTPELFMHAATPGSRSTENYNTHYEKVFLEHYQLTDICRIYADGFDPIKVFEDYAAWFAGPPAYIFEVFAHNLHRAVSEKGHTVLLSGFGGDQGVSGHVPIRFILPELLKHKAFGKAWRELSSQTMSRRLLRLIQYTHPAIHTIIQKAQDIKKRYPTHPYQRGYFKTLREAEWNFLQGPLSYEIRMRIE
ncbi:MAG: hypothetical protein K0U37_02240, partial [Gammaproteobacteria bacterium]|nr:hypothetical protein [Gammaproteobacteria bacterium]